MSETTIASLITLVIALGTVTAAHLLRVWRAKITKNRMRKAMLIGVREDVFSLLMEVKVVLIEGIFNNLMATLKIIAPILCNCVEQPQDYLRKDIAALAKIYRKYVHLKRQIYIYSEWTNKNQDDGQDFSEKTKLWYSIRFSENSFASEAAKQLKSLGVPICANEIKNHFEISGLSSCHKDRWYEEAEFLCSQD